MDQLVEGIQYTKIDEWYEMTQFEEEFDIWEEYLIPAQTSIYDYIKCDSNIERKFVEGLEHHKQVLLYFKLPQWFKVLTPIGGYNPDWAILWQERDAHGEPTDKKGSASGARVGCPQSRPSSSQRTGPGHSSASVSDGGRRWIAISSASLRHEALVDP